MCFRYIRMSLWHLQWEQSSLMQSTMLHHHVSTAAKIGQTNIGSGAVMFFLYLVATIGKFERFHLQSVTIPLNATKSYTLYF